MGNETVISIAAALTLGFASACGSAPEARVSTAELGAPMAQMALAVADIHELSAGHTPESSLLSAGQTEQDYIEATSLLLADAEARLGLLDECGAPPATPTLIRLGFVLKDLGIELVSHYVEANRLLDSAPAGDGATLEALALEEAHHQDTLATIYQAWRMQHQLVTGEMAAAGCVVGAQSM